MCRDVTCFTYFIIDIILYYTLVVHIFPSILNSTRTHVFRIAGGIFAVYIIRFIYIYIYTINENRVHNIIIIIIICYIIS